MLSASRRQSINDFTGNDLGNDWMISLGLDAFKAEDMFSFGSGNTNNFGPSNSSLDHETKPMLATNMSGMIHVAAHNMESHDGMYRDSFTDTDSETSMLMRDQDDDSTVTEVDSDDESQGHVVEMPVKKFRSARLMERADAAKRQPTRHAADHMVPRLSSSRPAKKQSSNSANNASDKSKQTPPRRRKHVEDMTPDELVRARELNKLAARRNRAARKAKWETQQRKIKLLDAENAKLKSVIDELRMQRHQMRQEVIGYYSSHPDALYALRTK